MARNAWCFVTCYQYLCGRVYILFRFVVDNPHSPSPNTFSLYVLGLYPAPLDVNVSERLLSHDSPVQHTESLFTVPGCDSAKEPLSRLFSEEEGTILAVVETVVRFFFPPSHPTGRCVVHLLVKGFIFTQHCSSCSESSLTYNESAWSKVGKKKTCSHTGVESIPDACVQTVSADEAAGCWSSVIDKHQPSSCPLTSGWRCVAPLPKSVLAACFI